MCRFLLYKGSDEILLSKLILDPAHSILKQSYDSRLITTSKRGANNADGFGIGFYTDPSLGAAPCLFTSTIPAWTCANLRRIASKTASKLIFAHVRAMTIGGSVSEYNCHPFCHGSLMWMHNGGIGHWSVVKRRLAERLTDRWYSSVRGTTDSEWAFALFLDTLERMGVNPSSESARGFGPTVLRRALLRTIHIINELTDAADAAAGPGFETSRSLLNIAVSDGRTVICTRYINSATDQAASLYYSSGSEWRPHSSSGDNRQFEMERRDKGADIILVASEPLSFERENWVNVPTNSVLTIHNQTVMVHPIVDQFFNHNPCHVRSSDYVHTQGLVSNEKSATRYATLISPAIPTLQAFPPLTDHHSRPVRTEQKPLVLAQPPTGTARPKTLQCSTPESPNPESHTQQSTVMARDRFFRRPLSLPDPGASSPLHEGALSCSPASQASTLSPSVPVGQTRTPASQGNISRKRASIHAHESARPGFARPGDPMADTLGDDVDNDSEELLEPLSPTDDTPLRSEFGNYNKLARFFPELTLS